MSLVVPIEEDERAMLVAARQTDPRIEILEDDLGRLGPIGNFGRLATVARAPQHPRPT